MRFRTLIPGVLALAFAACGSVNLPVPLQLDDSDEKTSDDRPRGDDATGGARSIKLNGNAATKSDLETLARFESAWGVKVPSGDYWYDDGSGSAGLKGGPTRGFIGAGLGLGGKQVPADASGGGDGRLTGVFINGREIHPLDVQGLTKMLGQAPSPGRWWVDGQGNFGPEGGGPLGNLLQIAQKRNGGGGNSYYKSDIGTGASTFVGSGCAAVTQRLKPSESDSSYSYYVGCE